ncbi:S1C family serine protease [Herbidospora cretacea]|uniref:S1C family serine protease n=1 Tax=Herbidospora cretacea TaxID=28444 RepID=UPI000773CE7D|nr:trypsin-like peptidase domain-containing protein [Herbidospora cretacea]
MSADERRENEQGTTEVLDARGWSQFGRRAPQHGDYRADQPTPQFAPPPPPQEPGPIQGHVGANPIGNTAVYGLPPVPPEPPRHQRSDGRAWKRGVSVLALAAVALGGGVAGALVTNALDDDATPVAVSPIANNGAPVKAPPMAGTIAAVAKAVQPSVVMITVSSGQGQGEGSGVILSADGLILTNNHVVAGAGANAQMQVKFSDGRTAQATLVGTDPTTDIAVIRATGVTGLTAASLGDSDALQVGESVLAIGSPLGLEGSVTSGIVSALDRTVTSGGGGGGGPRELPPGWGDGGFGGQQEQQAEPTTTIGGMVQTDAAINPGNSGGALVNASGQVIGINTAIATSGGGNGNIGVGFAIPINTARNVADQLIKTGKAVHAYLGVGVADATGDTPGALVSTVEPNGPAAKAGLQQGDIITKVDSTPIDAGETVVGIIRGQAPGDKVTVSYVRNGQAGTATITLEEKTTN